MKSHANDKQPVPQREAVARHASTRGDPVARNENVVPKLDNSPRQLVQRRLLGAGFGPALQMEADAQKQSLLQYSVPGQAAQLQSINSSAYPIQRTVWEWVGKYWHAVRTEGDITPQPGRPGGYVSERVSTGTEDPWGEAPAREERADEPEDVEDIPTQGGMAEDEARVFADKYHWDPVSTDDVTCSDPTHTPKGKVYTNGKVFYGADNTGHAGYGFKVWVREKGNRWKYCGNLVWGGAEWHYNARGSV